MCCGSLKVLGFIFYVRLTIFSGSTCILNRQIIVRGKVQQHGYVLRLLKKHKHIHTSEHSLAFLFKTLKLLYIKNVLYWEQSTLIFWNPWKIFHAMKHLYKYCHWYICGCCMLGLWGLCIPLLPAAAVMNHAAAALEFNIYTPRRPALWKAVFSNNPIAAGHSSAIFIPTLQRFLFMLWKFVVNRTITGNGKELK